MASQLARTAASKLPAHSVQSFEVGDEPDLYRFGFVGLHRVMPGQAGPLSWVFQFDAAQYAQIFRAYAGAIAPFVHGVTFAGPSETQPHSSWWAGLPRTGPGRAGIVTVHAYPFLTCAKPGQPRYPSLGGFLSPFAFSQFAAPLHTAADEVHARGVPLRITELGSASCGGAHGITDSFATALWAPDALFSLVAAGVDGVNVHVRWDSFNTPLEGPPTLTPRPLLYGMILFEQMLGPGATLVSTSVHTAPGARLSVWAVRLRGGALRVLVINRGARGATVRLALGRRSPGRVLAMRAPGLAADHGVTLGGASLGADGNWTAPQKLDAVSPSRGGTYNLAVPQYTAEVLSVP
jgi:hypothetical protein